ncbi:unnamed protein product [Brugia pahangi]|uniref:Ubiquitin-like domain-containing protein n=1 Tax=Brugia pahangi TaxID=6280 RepID=A0A0N4TL04_BRUPA|nr:unnamed protein product [Brugia pahangi]
MEENNSAHCVSSLMLEKAICDHSSHFCTSSSLAVIIHRIPCKLLTTSTPLIAFITRYLKVIVYNKTRDFVGQTIEITISAMDKIKTLKEKIMEKTDIPVGVQDITFGVQSLDDATTIKYYHIEDGYTVYCTPTYVEIPQQPLL